MKKIPFTYEGRRDRLRTAHVTTQLVPAGAPHVGEAVLAAVRNTRGNTTVMSREEWARMVALDMEVSHAVRDSIRVGGRRLGR